LWALAATPPPAKDAPRSLLEAEVANAGAQKQMCAPSKL